MSSNLKILTSLAFTFIFCYLFTHEGAGLNVFLLNLVTIPVMYLLTRGIRRSALFKVAVFCATATATATLLYGYWWPVMMNIISLSVLSGAVAMPQLKTIFVPILHSTTGILMAQANFVNEFSNAGSGKFRGVRFLSVLKISFIPVFILFLFLGMYASANPDLGTIVNEVSISIEKFFIYLLEYIDVETMLWLTLGMICGNILFLSKAEKSTEWLEGAQTELISRVRKKGYRFKFSSLRKEYRAGILMLLLLNLLLLFMNVLDIRLVWFGFEWSGQYLKQFVHSGTWTLIASIVLSMLIILFFFRKNLNFLSKNKWLRWLAYAWIAQNAVLAISVALRNYHYIEFYALAFKRIGVLIFLALVLFGLYSIYLKLRHKKSFFYLIRINGIALIMTLSLSTLPDWDNIIARYNFTHYMKAFVHYDFLAELDDRALANLDLSEKELRDVDFWQKINSEEVKNLDYSSDGWYRNSKIYMSSNNFHNKIASRKKQFLEEYQKKRWLSWNWGEWRAYNECSKGL